MKERYDPDKDIPRLPDGSVNVWTYLTQEGRDEIRLGTNFDGSKNTLPPYLDIDGVQIHPSRLPEILDQLAEMEKKGADEDEYYGILAVIRRYLRD